MEQIETAENNLTSIRFWVDNFQMCNSPLWWSMIRGWFAPMQGEQTAVSKHLMTKLVLCWETDEIVISNVAIANEFAFF
ncbi:MAG: hypothetical protein IPL28_26545 [Chloroflexi bacterium]|nr:hypothetical protein [Chloroflexota bacterium]